MSAATDNFKTCPAHEMTGVILMTTEFGLRLIGGTTPEGQINVDDAVAILQKLQELATKIGRVETGAEERGRPAKTVERVAKLRLVALGPGSTVIAVERIADDGTLAFELEHEQGFDEKFAEVVDAIGADQRPAWVSDTIAETAADLVLSLQKAAPRVEFSISGVVRRKFETSQTHRETWRPVRADTAQDSVTVVGRLYAVDLKSHRLKVQDDAGHEFALPKVVNDTAVGRFLGTYVSVTGAPERDNRGRLSQIHDATIEAAPQIAADAGARQSVPLDDILAAAPGPAAGGIEGLTEDEANAFFEALRA